jgi:CRP-like cAMP-binding protein
VVDLLGSQIFNAPEEVAMDSGSGSGSRLIPQPGTPLKKAEVNAFGSRDDEDGTASTSDSDSDTDKKMRKGTPSMGNVMLENKSRVLEEDEANLREMFVPSGRAASQRRTFVKRLESKRNNKTMDTVQDSAPRRMDLQKELGHKLKWLKPVIFNRDTMTRDLLMELVYTFPWELVLYACNMPEYRYGFFVRLLRCRYLMAYWSDCMDTFQAFESPGIKRALLIILLFALYAHVGAALYYALSFDVFRKGAAETWVSNESEYMTALVGRNADGGVDELEPLGERYLRAMYWAVQTMETVGFGDIVPVTIPETVFMCIFWYISAFMIQYAIANLVNTVNTLDQGRTKYKERIAALKNFASRRDLPKELVTRIESYYDYQWQKLEGVNEQAIMDELPYNLRAHVVHMIVPELFVNVDSFKSYDYNVLCAFADQVSTLVYSPGDIIVATGSNVKGIYIISRGLAVMQIRATIYEFAPGNAYGAKGLIRAYYSPGNLKAKAFSEILYLGSGRFRRILKTNLPVDQYEEIVVHGEETEQKRVEALQRMNIATQASSSSMQSTGFAPSLMEGFGACQRVEEMVVAERRASFVDDSIVPAFAAQQHVAQVEAAKVPALSMAKNAPAVPDSASHDSDKLLAQKESLKDQDKTTSGGSLEMVECTTPAIPTTPDPPVTRPVTEKRKASPIKAIQAGKSTTFYQAMTSAVHTSQKRGRHIRQSIKLAGDKVRGLFSTPATAVEILAQPSRIDLSARGHRSRNSTNDNVGVSSIGDTINENIAATPSGKRGATLIDRTGTTSMLRRASLAGKNGLHSLSESFQDMQKRTVGAAIFWPGSHFRCTWDMTIAVGLVFYMTATPSLISKMFYPQFYHSTFAVLMVGWTFDVLFLANMVFDAFFFAFFSNGVVLLTPMDIFRSYTKGNKDVLFDVVAVLPLELLVHSGMGIQLNVIPLLRLTKLLHLRKAMKYASVVEDQMKKVGLTMSFELSRFLLLNVLMFQICHYAGCLWVTAATFSTEVAGYETSWITRDQDWVSLSITPGQDVSYLRSIYWAMSGMSSSGMPDITSTNSVEMFACMLILFFGCQVLMGLIGSIASLMGSFNREKREHMAKTDQMRRLLRLKKINRKTRARIMRYYDYMWARCGGVNEGDVLSSLSPALREAVTEHVIGAAVAKISFFKDVKKDALGMIVGTLVPRTFLDKDTVVECDTFGKEMYIIERGVIAITNADKSIEFVRLKDGDYFGESVFLKVGRRTASGHAVGYCDTYFLTVEKFNEVSLSYPEDCKQIQERIHETMKSKLKKNRVQERRKATMRKPDFSAKGDAAANTTSFMGSRSFGRMANALSGKSSKSMATRDPSLWEDIFVCFIDTHAGAFLFDVYERVVLFFSHLFNATNCNPDSISRRVWDLCVLSFLTYNLIMVPLRMTMALPIVTYTTDWFLDALLLLDMWLHSSMWHIYLEGNLVVTKDDIREQYKSSRMWLDVIAGLPYDLLILPIYFGGVLDGSVVGLSLVMNMLRVPKLLWIVRFPSLIRQVERLCEYLRINYGPVRLFQLVFLVVVLGHWCACIFLVIAQVTGRDPNKCIAEPNAMYGTACEYEDTWIQELIHLQKLPEDGGLELSRYIRAMYWAVPALILAINGDFFPVNEVESTYIFVVMFCGLAINGTILGNIIALITNAEGEGTSLQRKKDKLAELLSTNASKDKATHERTLTSTERFIDYLMTANGQLASIQEAAFADLPHSLLHDINLQCKFQLLRSCPFFDSCADEVLSALVQRMKASLYGPGDSIIYWGDMGKEMYFIEMGLVEVVDRHGTTVFATLEKGAFFGETALFFKSPRMATIRALNICSLYTLEKGDFDKELALHEYDIQAMVTVFTDLQAKNKDRNSAIATNLSAARDATSKLYRMVDVRESATGSILQDIREQFTPMSPFRFFWNTLGLFALVYYAVKIPYDAAFVYGTWTKLLYLLFNFVVDAYWIIDIVFRCTVFSEEDDAGKINMDGATIRTRYMTEGSFYSDCFASLPVEVFALAAPPEYRMLAMYWMRLIHLVRLRHTSDFLNSTKAYLSHFCGVRLTSTSSLLVKAILLYMLSNHLLACGFFACHRYIEREEELTYMIVDGYADFDVDEGRHNVCNRHIFDCYVRSFYFVLATISAVGYGDVAAQTDVEAVLEIVTALVGACVTATICGAFGAILEEVDAAGDNAFQQKIRVVARFCRHKRLDEQLQGVVFAFYRNMWQRERRFDNESSLINNLSKPLRMEVQYATNSRAIKMTPLLYAQPDVTMRRFAAALTPQLFSAGFNAYHEGQDGMAVFFVSGGIFHTYSQRKTFNDKTPSYVKIQRLLDDNKDEMIGSRCGKGTHFGESCLSTRTGCRVNSARAVTDTEVYFLEKSDLWDILQFMQWWQRRDLLVGIMCSSAGTIHTPYPSGPPCEPPTAQEAEMMSVFTTAKYMHRLIQYLLEEIALHNGLVDLVDRKEQETPGALRRGRRRSTVSGRRSFVTEQDAPSSSSSSCAPASGGRPSLIDMSIATSSRKVQGGGTGIIEGDNESSSSSDDEDGDNRASFAQAGIVGGNTEDDQARRNSAVSVDSIVGSDGADNSNPTSRRASVISQISSDGDNSNDPSRRASVISQISSDVDLDLSANLLRRLSGMSVDSATSVNSDDTNSTPIHVPPAAGTGALAIDQNSADLEATPANFPISERRGSNPMPLGPEPLEPVREVTVPSSPTASVSGEGAPSHIAVPVDGDGEAEPRLNPSKLTIDTDL